MCNFTYIVSELGLFAKALNWKKYWLSQLRPFVADTVIEVGAGNGNNTGSFKIPTESTGSALNRIRISA